MIRFEPESHTYWLGDKRIHSVTQILGMVTDFSMVRPETLAYKARLGTAVHVATELYDLGTLDAESVHSAVLPYLEAWILFREETGFVPKRIEERIFHPVLQYAGTLDRTGTLNGDSHDCVLDIKSTAQLSNTVGMQTAAYQEGLAAGEQKDRPRKRYAVQLNPDGKYKLKEYTEPNDWANFVSLLNVKQWAEKHKTRVRYEP